MSANLAVGESIELLALGVGRTIIAALPFAYGNVAAPDGSRERANTRARAIHPRCQGDDAPVLRCAHGR